MSSRQDECKKVGQLVLVRVLVVLANVLVVLDSVLVVLFLSATSAIIEC